MQIDIGEWSLTIESPDYDHAEYYSYPGSLSADHTFFGVGQSGREAFENALDNVSDRLEIDIGFVKPERGLGFTKYPRAGRDWRYFVRVLVFKKG